MTGTEPVEVRTTGTAGICTRQLPAGDVPAEVDFLASTGKAHRIELRAVGDDTWLRVR